MKMIEVSVKKCNNSLDLTRPCATDA